MQATQLVDFLLETDEVDPESYLNRLTKAQYCPRCQGHNTRCIELFGSRPAEHWVCDDCGDHFMWSPARSIGFKLESIEPFEQPNDYSCGASVVHMLNRALGKINAEFPEVCRLCRTNRLWGTLPTFMASAMRKLGLPHQKLRAASAGHLAGELKGTVVAVLTAYEGVPHWILVTGWDGRQFSVHDPAQGLVVYSPAQMDAVLSKQGLTGVFRVVGFMLGTAYRVECLAESDDANLSVDYMGYIEQAHMPWSPFRLITNKEWRAFFRELGYKVYRLYAHKSRRYAHMTATLHSTDGHPVDHFDAALLTEYTYEMLEKRFNKNRHDLNLTIRMTPCSAATCGPIASDCHLDRKGNLLNQIDMTVLVPDPQYCSHSDYYPLDRL